MRLFLALVCACAVGAQAQPSAVDSANVERVLDDAMLETSLLSFKQSAGPAAAVLPIDEFLTVATLRDSVRTLFYADMRPDLLRDAVAFSETAAYQNAVAEMQMNQADPTRMQALMDQLETGTGPRADSGLVVRFLDATLAYEITANAQTGMFTALMDSIPTMGDAYTAMASAGGMTLDSMMASMQTSIRYGLTEGTRIALAETPPADVEASIAFYESPAGPYVQRTVAEGVQRAMIPALIRMTRSLEATSQGARLDPVEPTETPLDSPLDVDLSSLYEQVVYPESALMEGLMGLVVVSFSLDEHGAIVNATCTRSHDPRFCAAALDAFTSSRIPHTDSTELSGDARYTLKVVFRLEGSDPIVENPTGFFDPLSYTVTPELIGGLEQLQDDLVYPASAREDGVEGRVFVSFVVGADGIPGELECHRAPDDRLCAAALDVVRSRRFKPGTFLGHPEPMRYSLPVHFQL